MDKDNTPIRNMAELRQKFQKSVKESNSTIGPSITSRTIQTIQDKELALKMEAYIQAIQLHLIQTHAAITKWFDEEETVKNYRPKDGGWTISEVLEHITLTSHYLLILIEKAAKKAGKNIQDLDLEVEAQNYHFDLSHLDRIALPSAFKWVRPEHMEPTGIVAALKIKASLIHQLTQCLLGLEMMKGGHGLLYKTTMSVDDLGKLNVYEYLFFLSKHAERHIAQMRANKVEYLA